MLAGVVPAGFPSTRMVAPRGRESTKMLPAKVCCAGSRGGAVHPLAAERPAAGAGVDVRALTGCSRTDTVRIGCRVVSVTSSFDEANPGCTTRTVYVPSGRASSVIGVRPRHFPLTVTPARDGVESTVRRALEAAAGALAVCDDVSAAGASPGTGGASPLACGAAAAGGA